MDADSEVVMVRLPERIVVPFFFTFTSKLPPVGRVPREIASFENVTPWESRTDFTTPAMGTPEVEYSKIGEGHPPPLPLDAAVIRPFESTVMDARVYEPGVTAVGARVAAKLPVPLPVTSPVRVMVWSPVLVPLDVPLPDGAPTSEAVMEMSELKALPFTVRVVGT